MDSNILWVYAAVTVAALLHGISGMGFSLITIAAISESYPLSEAIILVLLPTALLNVSAWLSGKGRVRHHFCHYLGHYWQLVLLSLAGGIVGAYLLLWLNQAYLMLLLSLVVLWYAITALSGKALKLADTRRNMVIVGLVGGIVGGATNAMAPVLVMYLLSVSNDKNTIIRVSNLCFFTGKLAQFIVLFDEFAALDSNGWQLIATIAALSLLFMLLGTQLGRFLPTRMFRLLILWILILLGLRLGYYAVLSLS